MFPNQQGRDSWGSVAGELIISTRFVMCKYLWCLGYYGNYGMPGMAGSNSGSWYSRSSQPGWMGGWGYPGGGSLSPTGAGKSVRVRQS